MAHQSRIPEVGNDGLRRLDCPRCGALQFRFGPDLSGGPVERRCRGCAYTMVVYFNTEGPSVGNPPAR